jgi:hypothetical protein
MVGGSEVAVWLGKGVRVGAKVGASMEVAHARPANRIRAINPDLPKRRQACENLSWLLEDLRKFIKKQKFPGGDARMKRQSRPEEF